MTTDGPDERDTHHANLEIGLGGMLFSHRKGIHDVKVYAPLTDGLAREGRQFLPHLERRVVGLDDESSFLAQAAQRIGVTEHLVVGGDDDFDILQLRVGDLDRFGAEGDVEIGRRTALFRAVFRRGFRVQFQHPGEDIGQ